MTKSEEQNHQFSFEHKEFETLVRALSEDVEKVFAYKNKWIKEKVWVSDKSWEITAYKLPLAALNPEERKQSDKTLEPKTLSIRQEPEELSYSKLS